MLCSVQERMLNAWCSVLTPEVKRIAWIRNKTTRINTVLLSFGLVRFDYYGGKERNNVIKMGIKAQEDRENCESSLRLAGEAILPPKGQSNSCNPFD